ncbi:Maf family protein [Dokdonella sp.]|uniref:Maf family protein n=1 Tax=Dokdonella sp. TaxID=2291710 RepID=UPI0025C082B3|nr:Maf family protein [Dokdonella sp.]MBX3688360.1 septum formation inhibitor Maf [Dokdonella sp.]
MNHRLFLASRSPRRQDLLRQLGLTFQVLDVDIAEVRAPGEAPLDYVRRVAREKAAAGLMQVAGVAGALVIGADTEVILDDEVFGKPVDSVAAIAMLGRLSGRSHQVASALWLLAADREESALQVSTVRFDSLEPAAIAAYVATGEPFGKAGAYAIQGRAAAFIRHLDGSHSSVMGLPLRETARLLARFGVSP